MKKILLLLLVIILYNYGCKEKTTNPPEEQKPIGYQEDIPWPSLANSPWPIFHGDPQNTGRSKYPGPTSGIVQYVIENKDAYSGVVVGEDSSFFFVSRKDSGLFCYDQNGNYKWNYKVEYRPSIPSTPLIANDGTIYFTANPDPYFYAIKRDGTLKWKKKIYPMSQRGINIGKDGTIYLFTYTGKTFLTAISPQGDSLWSIMNNDFFADITILSSDSKTIFTNGFKRGCYAIDIERQQIKWIFGYQNYFSGHCNPLTDFEGNVYVITNYEENSNETYSLFSLNKYGQIRWKYKIFNNNYENISIDKYGNIYFALDTLQSLDINGNLRWKYALKGYLAAPITIDRNNNLFFLINSINQSGVIALANDKKIIWENYNISNFDYGGIPLAIGYNNSLYINSYNKQKIYFIR
ncbi:MAG: hypothetical protein EPN88_17630 [Bacteroidetes bacterium]|nr:MAG: hypothetical protein EPN88_17630 [Bacteroidota bacterium]